MAYTPSTSRASNDMRHLVTESDASGFAARAAANKKTAEQIHPTTHSGLLPDESGTGFRAPVPLGGFRPVAQPDGLPPRHQMQPK